MPETSVEGALPRSEEVNILLDALRGSNTLLSQLPPQCVGSLMLRKPGDQLIRTIPSNEYGSIPSVFFAENEVWLVEQSNKYERTPRGYHRFGRTSGRTARGRSRALRDVLIGSTKMFLFSLLEGEKNGYFGVHRSTPDALVKHSGFSLK